MKAYLASITEYSDRDILERKMSLLCMERLQKAELCRNDEEKQRSVAAGLLLQYGLECYRVEKGYPVLEQDREGRPVIKIEKGPNGKPYLPEYPELSFSLSHSGAYVAAAFDTKTLGIDIQQMRKASPEAMIRKFHPKEQAYFAGQNKTKEAFFLLWCIKEAYMKFTGKGFSQGFQSFYGKPEDGTVRNADGDVVAYFREITMPDTEYKAVIVGEEPFGKDPVFEIVTM